MTPRRELGFSLVELMIALVLGLVIISGVTGVFLSNKQSYRTNNALSQVQENSRIAFELLARDIRQAGLTGCGNTTRVANVLNNPTTNWWSNFNNALRGYDDDQTDPAVTTGSGVAQRVNGTDSVQIMGIANNGLSVEDHNPSSAQLKISDATTDLASGDIILVCDPDHATITQITNYNNSNVTLVHNTGTGTPGNCSKGLGFPTDCSSTNGNPYEFGANSQVAKIVAMDWYIGNNPQGGRSLYQLTLRNNSGTIGTAAQEMVRNVTDMQIQYLVSGSAGFIDADAVTNWSAPAPGGVGVVSVRVTLTLEGVEQRAGTDAQPITRQLTTTLSLRNRLL